MYRRFRSLKNIRYYCKNGEPVEIRLNPVDHTKLIVTYRGKKYSRPTSCIGKKLFLQDPTAVCINSIVTLCNTDTGEIFVVSVVQAHTTVKFLYSSGIYGRDFEEISDPRAGKSNGDMTLITDASPIGKAAMGKRINSCFSVVIDGQHTTYEIRDIDNSLVGT